MLFARIAELLAGDTGLRKEDVFIKSSKSREKTRRSETASRNTLDRYLKKLFTNDVFAHTGCVLVHPFANVEINLARSRRVAMHKILATIAFRKPGLLILPL